MIEFASVRERAAMTGPSGEPMVQEIEHRTDPLTGTVCSINGFLGEKAKAFLGAPDRPLLERIEEESRAACPFCVAHERGTRFPEALCEGGLVRVGDSVGVPNLFSKAGLDAVVVVSHRQHTLFPSRIPVEDFRNAVKAGIGLIRAARERYGLAHHLVGMNFLPPGGSSVPHPHLQAIARQVPYSGVGRLLALSEDHRRKTGTDFWRELCETERGGPRHVGTTGGVEWIAPFAPSRQKEVWGILPGTGSLSEVGDADAEAFGTGIRALAAWYEREGNHAFTLAFLSAPEPGAGERFGVQVRICARPAVRPLYSNYDTWFAPLFVGDEVHTQPPEAHAARMREDFED